MILNIKILFPFFFLISFVTAEIKDKEFAECAAIINSIDRLECFDKIAEKYNLDKPITNNIISNGEWIIEEKISPIDDSRNVYLKLKASDGVSGKYGGVEYPWLHIRCKEGETALSIWWGGEFLGTDDMYVTHRIGKNKAEKENWGISTSHEHIGKWRKKTSIPFIEKLFDEEKLLIQLTPHGENSQMTTFNISGLKESIKILRDECKW